MNNELMLNPETNQNAKEMATSLAQSKMIPYGLAGKAVDIYAIILMGHELNIPPMAAVQNISVIQGKPTVSPQMMLGMVFRAMPNAVIKTEIDEENKVVKVTTARSLELYTAEMHYTATWNVEKATAMGLIGKDNYKKQLINMLKWRATAEACRVTFPDIILGLYIPMEFETVAGEEIREIKTVQQELDEEHPIPEEEKEIGSGLYRIQHGKHRGKKLEDLELDEIEARIEYFDKKLAKNDLTEKYREQHLSMVNYLTNLEISQPWEDESVAAV